MKKQRPARATRGPDPENVTRMQDSTTAAAKSRIFRYLTEEEEADFTLKPNRKKVLNYVRSVSNESGIIYARQERISEKTGLGERTVRNCLRELERRGLLPQPVRRGKKLPNVYDLRNRSDRQIEGDQVTGKPENQGKVSGKVTGKVTGKVPLTSDRQENTASHSKQAAESDRQKTDLPVHSIISSKKSPPRRGESSVSGDSENGTLFPDSVPPSTPALAPLPSSPVPQGLRPRAKAFIPPAPVPSDETDGKAQKNSRAGENEKLDVPMAPMKNWTGVAPWQPPEFERRHLAMFRRPYGELTSDERWQVDSLTFRFPWPELTPPATTNLDWRANSPELICFRCGGPTRDGDFRFGSQYAYECSGCRAAKRALILAALEKACHATAA